MRSRFKWPDDFVNKVICGDCLEVMKEMPDECIDMCLTSIPYWGLRDYGIEQILGGDDDCRHDWTTQATRSKFCSKCRAWKGQLGLEPTPELYIEHMTAIFSEVKRVLRKEGTLWLNIGDTYSGGGTHHGDKNLGKNEGIRRSGFEHTVVTDLPPKCLCMIPERLAWSLIQDGWILRNKIIWYKPNSMPSSVKDRFSNKWEYVFLFSKNRKYYFDLDAVREVPITEGLRQSTEGRGHSWYNHKNDLQIEDRGDPEHNAKFVHPLGKNPGDVFEIGAETRTLGAIIGLSGAVKVPGGKGWTGHPKGGGAACQKDPRWSPPKGPNPGDFWSLPTQPFPESHFAVFPERLCEKPIKSGCPEGGILLDPFCGSGTALYVAKEMRRRYIGIDLKQEYCDMSVKRLAQKVLWF